MLLVFSVSWEAVTLSANKNQQCYRWPSGNGTLKNPHWLDKPCVCVSVVFVHMYVCSCMSSQTPPFSRGALYLWPPSFCLSWQFSKDKRFTFLPEKVIHNTPEKEGVWNAFRSVSCLQICLCMGRSACRILSHGTHRVQTNTLYAHQARKNTTSQTH